MSWCLCDVTAIYGEAGLRRRTDEWTDGEVPVIYPDSGPLPVNRQPSGPETIPAPNSQPGSPAKLAPPHRRRRQTVPGPRRLPRRCRRTRAVRAAVCRRRNSRSMGPNHKHREFNR